MDLRTLHNSPQKTLEHDHKIATMHHISLLKVIRASQNLHQCKLIPNRRANWRSFPITDNKQLISKQSCLNNRGTNATIGPSDEPFQRNSADLDRECKAAYINTHIGEEECGFGLLCADQQYFIVACRGILLDNAVDEVVRHQEAL